MKIARSSLLITILLTVLSCLQACNITGPPAVDSDNVEKSNGIDVELIPPQRIIQGSPVHYTFHIRNNTNHPLVLLELTRAPSQFQVAGGKNIRGKNLQEGARTSWVHNPPGILTYEQTKDRIKFSSVEGFFPRRSDYRLYSGLLMPGEKTVAKIRAIHQNTGQVKQKFLLRFHHPNLSSLNKNVYLPPKNTNIRSASSVFFHPPNDKRDQNPFSTQKYVILRKPFQDTEEKIISRNVRVHPRPFSLRDALDKLKKKLGKKFQPEDVRYSPWLERWVVLNQVEKTSYQLWSISRWNIESLPPLPFSHFKKLNAGTGPLMFYVENDFGGISILQNLMKQANLEKKNLPVKPGQSFQASRKQSMKLLHLLVKQGIPLKWIRQPLTDKLTVKIISSP